MQFTVSARKRLPDSHKTSSIHQQMTEEFKNIHLAGNTYQLSATNGNCFICTAPSFDVNILSLVRN